MSSKTSKVIKMTLKKLVQVHFNPHLNVEKLRIDDFDRPSPMAKKHCRAEDFRLGTIRGSWLFPLHKKSNKIILYFHGGGYVCGPSILQWRMLSHISSETGCTSLMINYRTAPEHQYPAAIDDMDNVYEFLAESFNREHIIFMGDSAGGGLALGLAMKLRDLNKQMPGKLVLLSPWLDVSMNNPETAGQIELDHMLAVPGLVEAGDLYRGTEKNDNPYISPVKGNLSNLPPVYLMIGTHDLLLPDCRILRRRALAAGMDLLYEEWDEMFHVWMLNVPYLPEAKEAVSKIINFIDP